MDLAGLKHKYSGQEVPQWELEKAGLTGKPEADAPDASDEPVRKTRRRKTED